MEHELFLTEAVTYKIRARVGLGAGGRAQQYGNESELCETS